MAAEMTGRLAALDGDVEAAYVALKRAIELCEADGIWWDVAVLASDVGLHASMLGAHADAIEIFERGLRAAAMLRLTTSSAVLTSQLAVAHLAVGDPDGAERLSAHAVALAEEADTVFGRALALTNRARVAWGIGRTDLALDVARDALAVAEAAGTPSLARGPRQLIAEVTSTLVAEGEAG